MRPLRARSLPAKATRSGGRGSPTRAKAETRRSERTTPAPQGSGASAMVRDFLGRIREVPLLRRPMLIGSLCLVGIAGGTGLFAGGQVASAIAGIGAFVEGTSIAGGFALDSVVISGDDRTSPNAVYDALGLKQGESIFAADPAAIRTRLLELPWVADAVVERRFPATVNIALIERRPFAVWQSGDILNVVERSGAIIRGQRADDFAKLPLLIGAGAAETAAPLIDKLSGLRATGVRVRAVERVSRRRWDLILDRGVRVRLPESGWDIQLDELETLIVDRGILERDVEIIDLRYPENYIFQLHNGDSRPVSRERPA